MSRISNECRLNFEYGLTEAFGLLLKISSNVKTFKTVT